MTNQFVEINGDNYADRTITNNMIVRFPENRLYCKLAIKIGNLMIVQDR
jgi:hypothetical protein